MARVNRHGAGVPARQVGGNANTGIPARQVGGQPRQSGTDNRGRGVTQIAADLEASARLNPSHSLGARQLPGNGTIGVSARVGTVSTPVITADLHVPHVVLRTPSDPPVLIDTRGVRRDVHTRPVRRQEKGFFDWLSDLFKLIFCCKRPSR